MPFPTLRYLAIIVLVSLAGISSSSPAAEPVAPPSRIPSDVAAAAVAKPRTTSLNIDFPGGSIAQLLALINQSESARFNLIGEKPLQETKLPGFSLRNSDPGSLAIALNSLLRPSGLGLSLAGSNIFVLANSTPATSSFAPPALTFQAFQLGPYLATVSLEDITDAIVTAWSAKPGHDSKTISFKFHPATKLLFLYGPPEAITMATQLIPQLNPAAALRVQREAFSSALPPIPPVPNPDLAAERARLDATVQDIQRRREQREDAKVVLPPLEKK